MSLAMTNFKYGLQRNGISMNRWSARKGLTLIPTILVAAGILAISGWMLVKQVWIADASNSPRTSSSPRTLSDISKQAAVRSSAPRADAFHVSVRPGPATPRTILKTKSSDGNATVSVSCSTCHQTRTPNVKNKRTNDLDEFHQGLAYSHNSLSCLSCHNPNDYDSLRLADGTAVAYKDVMKLCAQCHGPQMRDYEQGAHGGMTGYWDLKRGPRQRNNCVDCHHPHTPKFPKMKPTFKPRDRFLTDASEHKKTKAGSNSHE